MSELTRPDRKAQSEIAECIANYVQQMERRDLDAAADFYAHDARLFGPDTDLDREGVLEAIRSVFESGIQVQVDRRTVELFVHGDTAYEIARAEDTLVNLDGSSNTVRNNLFIRWDKGQDGKWRFARVLLSPTTHS